LRLFSFGGYGLALAALALVVFGAYDSYPFFYLVKNCDTPVGFTITRRVSCIFRQRLFLFQGNQRVMTFFHRPLGD